MEPSFPKASKLLKQTESSSVTDHLELDLIEGAQKRAAFLDLLNRSFAVPVERDFFQDFPIWDETRVPSGTEMIRLGIYSHKNSQLTRQRLESPVLAASAGVRLAELRVGVEQEQRTIKVALIGAVATDPAFRERGLATQLVRTAIQWATERSACAVFLWGSEHRLYQKLGFELCGEQQLIGLSDLMHLNQPEGSGSDDLQAGWNPGIFELMKKRPMGLSLSSSDLSWVSSHHFNSASGGLEWYYSGSPCAPTAYTAVGRGVDLHGIVHEWGGHPESLRKLWSELFRKHPLSKDLKVLGSKQLFGEWGFNTSAFPEEFHCLAKIIDPKKIMKGYLPEADLTQPAFQALLAAAPNELPQLLFGPHVGLQGLRLPLWLWGLDAT